MVHQRFSANCSETTLAHLLLPLAARLALGVSGLATLMHPPPMHAQTAIRRPKATEVGQVELHHRLLLEPPHAHVSDYSEVTINPRTGEALVGRLGRREELMDLFDKSGRHLRSLDRLGGVALRRVTWLQFDRSGSLHLQDQELGEILSIDPTGKLSRRIRLPVDLEYPVHFPDGSFVASGAVATRESAGQPLHLFSASGTLLRSFGDISGTVLLPGYTYRRMRATTPAHDGGLWAALPNRYEIQRWSRDGRLVATLHSAPEWFETWERDPVAQANVERPHTVLKGLFQDGQGLLWLMFQLPDARWTPRAPSGTPRVGGHVDEPLLSAPDKEAYFDSIIEVVDPRTGRLVASTRFDGLFHPFLNDGSVSRLVTRANKLIGLEVLAPTVVPSPFRSGDRK